MQYFWDNTNLFKVYSKNLYLEMFPFSTFSILFAHKKKDTNIYKFKKLLEKT